MTDEERLEQERLRELNEALSALIGNIQLTDQAVEKLGKRLGVDKIKAQAEDAEKAAKAAKAAADANTQAVGANTTATVKQTEEEKKRAKDQEDLFEREKKNRNIAIDENGKVISTVVELTKQHKELLQEGDKLNAARKAQADRENEARKAQLDIENAALNAKIAKESAVLNKQVATANSTAKYMSAPGEAVKGTFDKFKSLEMLHLK
jgi:hypothetical protein